MYKVFFNATSIILCPKFENSSKDNNQQVIEIEDDVCFHDWILKLEKKNNIRNIIFVNNNISQLWENFKKQFIGITAAGGVVNDKTGRILVIKRFGLWDLPKGKVERDESLEKAAIREVEEECGISGLKIKTQLGSMFHLYRSPYHAKTNNIVLKETFWFEMFYEGTQIPVPQKKESIEEARWMKREELKLFFSNTYPNLIELLENYLQKSSEKI